MSGDETLWANGRRPIRLDDERLELVVRFGFGLFKRKVSIPLEQMRSLQRSVSGRGLLVGSASQAYWIRDVDVGDRAELDRLQAELVHRIRLHPQAPRIRLAIATNEALERRLLARRPRVTTVLVAVCAAIYMVQSAWGATLWAGLGGDGVPQSETFGSMPLRLARAIALGANAPALVNAGEYFRLATANFLHAHLIHIGINLFGLWSLGPLLEQLLGGWRVTAVVLLSGLAGAAASAWGTAPTMSVGVSTSLFGLLGAYLILWLRFRRDMPPTFVVSGEGWIQFVVVNGILWSVFQGIDHVGHLGGGLAGAAFVVGAFPPGRKIDLVRPVGLAGRAATAVLVFAYVAAAVWAADVAVNRPLQQGLVPVVRAESARAPQYANEIAWSVAVSPAANRELLEAALEPAVAAVAKSEGTLMHASVLDTLATLYYRLGRHSDAVETSLRAVLDDPNAELRNQHARFLQAYLREYPTYVSGIENPRPVQIQQDGSQVSLTRNAGLPDLLVVLLVEKNGRLEGSFWVEWPEGANQTTQWTLPSSEGAARQRGTAVTIGLVATNRVTDAAQQPAVDFLAFDEATRSLP